MFAERVTTKPTNDDRAYYNARIEMHTRYLQLEEQAYRLLQRIQSANGSLTRLAIKAERRWRRRCQCVRAWGLDEEQMQRLDTGDDVHWRGQTLTITDWTCHRDPVFGPNGRRIWAEPILKDEKGQMVYVAPIFWHELV